MMNQEEIGQIATLLDRILKNPFGMPNISIYQTLKNAHKFMQDAIGGKGSGFDALKSEIERNYKGLLE